jgi:hypothetical protein
MLASGVVIGLFSIWVALAGFVVGLALLDRHAEAWCVRAPRKAADDFESGPHVPLDLHWPRRLWIRVPDVDCVTAAQQRRLEKDGPPATGVPKHAQDFTLGSTANTVPKELLPALVAAQALRIAVRRPMSKRPRQEVQ